MDPHAAIVADLPRLLCLLVALVGGVLAANTWWRRQRPSAMAGPQRVTKASMGKIVYHDTPTVRAVDSQRVDRLRKVVQLAPGEFIDVIENRGSPVPRFRITVKSTNPHADTPTARVLVEFGGTAVSCGPQVQEVGNNEFILPRCSRDEPRTSIVHFHERGDTLDFMRIKLRGLDAASGAAEIDVTQVCGRWPATEDKV